MLMGREKSVSKRVRARFYTATPISRRHKDNSPDPQGYLFAYGKYQTKIRADDLPEWYVGGDLYKTQGYISANGVKYLFYKPNYASSHLYRDDMLFISYGEPIVPVSADGVDWFRGYDERISGALIPHFVREVKRFSRLDIDSILEELKKKQTWYDEKNR